MSATLPQNELLQPIPAVAERISGKRPSPATCWRWTRKGCRGVRLKAVILSGQWHCTEDDFRRFLDEQTAVALKRHSEADDALLESAGLL